MRIYMSVDMEGGTGIIHRQQLVPDGKDYQSGRKLLTADVVAAIEGAREAGATEFLVNDSHGTMRNLLIEDLPAEARLIAGPASTRNKPLCQTQGADEGWDLAFLVGYHARAGATPGLLAHTWVGALIHEVTINGVVSGETAINATVLGHFGVPVGLVTGADDVAAEARETLGEVETAEVKRALGPTAAICMPPEASKVLIRDAARRAVERRDAFLPFGGKGPVEVSITTHQRAQAEKAAQARGLELTGERTFTSRADTAPEAMAGAWRGVEMALREESEWLS
jgi:D-amino peptidase